MSKQEILSWTSLATSTSVMIFYLLIAFGWPEFLPDYSGNFIKIFFNLFWIAVVIEIIVEAGSKKNKIDKDERDFMIEAFGLRYAYNFLVTVLATVVVSIFISILFGEYSNIHLWLGSPLVILHVLFVTLFTASAIKRITIIYQYRKLY